MTSTTVESEPLVSLLGAGAGAGSSSPVRAGLVSPSQNSVSLLLPRSWLVPVRPNHGRDSRERERTADTADTTLGSSHWTLCC